jgi:hypothetical protein
MAQMTSRFSKGHNSHGNGASLVRWLGMVLMLIVVIVMMIQNNSSSNHHSSLLLSNDEDDSSQDTLQDTIAATAVSMTYDFEKIGLLTGTDKVQGPKTYSKCLEDPKFCRQPQLLEPKCRTGANHFYHTLYNARLGPLFARDDIEPFQML